MQSAWVNNFFPFFWLYKVRKFMIMLVSSVFGGNNFPSTIRRGLNYTKNAAGRHLAFALHCLSHVYLIFYINKFLFIFFALLDNPYWHTLLFQLWPKGFQFHRIFDMERLAPFDKLTRIFKGLLKTHLYVLCICMCCVPALCLIIYRIIITFFPFKTMQPNRCLVS